MDILGIFLEKTIALASLYMKLYVKLKLDFKILSILGDIQLGCIRISF